MEEDRYFVRVLKLFSLVSAFLTEMIYLDDMNCTKNYHACKTDIRFKSSLL